MSTSTKTTWGYIVNASAGTGSVSVYAYNTSTFAFPSIMAVSMAGSATTDYAILSDTAGNIVGQLIAQGANYQVLGGIRLAGLTCQVFGGTNGTVSIFVP